MIEAPTTDLVSTPLFWLPRATQPVRNQFGRADGIAMLLKRLADESADVVITVLSNPHVMQLIVFSGKVVGASLTSGGQQAPLQGEAALRAWTERTEPDAGARSQISPLDHPIAESLGASLDPHPETTPLVSVEQLREALRHLASVSQHGVVDVTSGSAWGRVLFSHGRVLGAFQSDALTVLPSLAGIGKLVSGEDVLMTVRTARPQDLKSLSWAAAAPAAEPAMAAAASVEENAHDERIESDLLWLLSDVDRDRERASRASASDAQLMQVLASFANATFAMATDLAASSVPPRTPPDLSRVLADLTIEHPALNEVRLKGGRIDASALAKRCKSMSMEGNEAIARIDFFGSASRGLLGLARHGVGRVSEHMESPSVALRCATALEACMISIELELPSRRFRVGE